MRRSTPVDSISPAPPSPHPGTRELGPSDLSDTGSDSIGAAGIDDDTDSSGTGEGRDAGGVRVPEGRDLAPDHFTDDETEGSGDDT
ncbi:MAG TPA: MatE family transporter [Burkholderiales bacterium]